MEYVHRIDDHGAVSRIFASGVGEFLDGTERMQVDHFLPAIHMWRGPVPVDSPDGGLAVFGNFFKNFLNQFCLCIITVNQDSDVEFVVVHV